MDLGQQAGQRVVGADLGVPVAADRQHPHPQVAGQQVPQEHDGWLARPLQIVEDQHQWPRPGHRRQQLRDRFEEPVPLGLGLRLDRLGRPGTRSVNWGTSRDRSPDNDPTWPANSVCGQSRT